MKDYDSMSDSELSLDVGRLVIDGICSYMTHESKAIFNTRDDAHFVEFDINNPSDMWSIIVDNKITISPIRLCRNCKYEYPWSASHDIDNAATSIEVWHENPLRAAAICYLKIMENQK